MTYDELLKFSHSLSAENTTLRKQITFLKDSHDAMRELAYKTGVQEEREACAEAVAVFGELVTHFIRERGEKCPT
jgi:hypothetical protein